MAPSHGFYCIHWDTGHYIIKIRASIWLVTDLLGLSFLFIMLYTGTIQTNHCVIEIDIFLHCFLHFCVVSVLRQWYGVSAVFALVFLLRVNIIYDSYPPTYQTIPREHLQAYKVKSQTQTGVFLWAVNESRAVFSGTVWQDFAMNTCSRCFSTLRVRRWRGNDGQSLIQDSDKETQPLLAGKHDVLGWCQLLLPF